ncbi:hypothetical protein BCR36DRAFT_343537 [Piromyces finnis]|uniref:W2 domain-containing protein n=1 Tax=Piromyces finnis TaxID=1754191 RepID=A0A1Y1VJX5_9FUNG|nr:hypothetical protein BCR36DRAFT_343537 [Piromyces finnis]|eukprot:ORX58393.1 hypothetical protein BCR36DRAFT_343537 [Piromyces finnis]
MEGIEVNQAIEKVNETVNKEENETLLTIVFPTIVIILLLKKILKYNNNQNERINISEDYGNKIQKSCPIYEALCLAAVETSNEKSSLSLNASKHNSYITGHHHSHYHSFKSLYCQCGIKGIKKFLKYSIIRLNPISLTIANKKELKYYKKRLIEVETYNKLLVEKLRFCNKKSDEISKQLENEKNAYEIKENCLKESYKKLEKSYEECFLKCGKLEDENKSLKRQIDMQSHENDNDYSSDEDDSYSRNYSEDGFKSSMESNIFKRQEEQRRIEEEAKKLLSDLDKRGIDDFILEVKEGKSKFCDVAPLILNQMIVDDLDAVYVSIELDKIVKKCETKRKEVLSAFVDVICDLIEKKKQKKAKICVLEFIRKYVALFQEYVGPSKKDKLHLLNLIYNHFKATNSLKHLFINVIDRLYNLNIIDASAILDWYHSQDRDVISTIEDDEEFRTYMESLTYESFKKSILLKKEYNSYEALNDSGFCSNNEDDGEYENQLLDLNSRNSSFTDNSSSICDGLENQNTHCHCCNCKHNADYDSFIFKEKSNSHVHFNFDIELETSTDHLLLDDYDNNKEEIILKDDSDSFISNFSADNQCLLDIIENFDEKDGISFFIQDTEDESLFSDKKILNEDCCCKDRIEKDISFNEENNILNEESTKNSFIEEIVVVEYVNSENPKTLFINQDSIYEEEIEEEEIEEEVYILSKDYSPIKNIIEYGENDNSEEEQENYIEENVGDSDIEICFEKVDGDKEFEEEKSEFEYEESEDDNEESDDESEEYESEEDESEEDDIDDEIEIIFERNASENEEDEGIEICFSREESESELESELESESESDLESKSESESESDLESDDEIEKDCKECDNLEIYFTKEAKEMEEDSEFEICFEVETNEKNDILICNVNEYNSESLKKEYEKEQLRHKDQPKKVFQLINDSESESESECESDSEEESEIDDDIEIAFERPYDAENEKCSDESLYTSESESGSDTEFDDEKIERIASIPSVLPFDEYTFENKEGEDKSKRIVSHVEKLHSISSESSETIENNIESLDDSRKNKVMDISQNNGINSDLDEIIYDSDIDIVFCSSDCTIEISDDQDEVEYLSNKIIRTSSPIQIQENKKKENNELYQNLEEENEGDQQRKSRIRNSKKKSQVIRKNTTLQKLISLYCNEPSAKHEIDDVLGKYSNISNSSKPGQPPELFEQFNQGNIKKSFNRSKKALY